MTPSLQDLLDAFLNGDCPPEAFLSELSAYCNATPDSSWEVLALLDQYHRRGKLSGEHFRAFRRKVEFRALGIPESPPAKVEAAVAAPVQEVDAGEITRLRSALETERERSRRYRRRIARLAEYGHRRRTTSSSRALVVVPTNPRVPTGKSLATAWLAQQRRVQRPHTWSSAALLIVAATVISGSSSNLGQISSADLATTPVTLEAAPALPAAILEPRTISLASEKFFVLPGSSRAIVTVVRTGELGDVTRFRLWTRSAGAKTGEDYVGQSRIAQFEPGEASIQLPVQVLANPQRTHTEMFYVGISGADDEAGMGPNPRAAVFIMRKD